jgi:hypothetical protein
MRMLRLTRRRDYLQALGAGSVLRGRISEARPRARMLVDPLDEVFVEKIMVQMEMSNLSRTQLLCVVGFSYCL